MEGSGEESDPLAAAHQSLRDLRAEARAQEQRLADLRSACAKADTAAEARREEIERLRHRCDRLAAAEGAQLEQTEEQMAKVAELREQCATAQSEAARALAAEGAMAAQVTELRLKLGEVQSDEALRARVAELEARLASGGSGDAALLTLQEKCDRLERRVESAREAGLAVAEDEEEDELQLELRQALREQSELQEQLRAVVTAAPPVAGTGDARGPEERPEVQRLRSQLEHETSERAAAEALAASLKQHEDKRVDEMRQSLVRAGELARACEEARDAAVRELAASRASDQQLSRGQVAEERRLRKELALMSSQLEDAKAEAEGAKAEAAVAEEAARMAEATVGAGEGVPVSAVGELSTLLVPSTDGASGIQVGRVTHRDVRELRRDRDRAVAEARRLRQEHELARAELAASTTESIRREQERAAALEAETEELRERLELYGGGEGDDAEEGVRLRAEVRRLEGLLAVAAAKEEGDAARLAKSEAKAKDEQERLREGYEDDIGRLEAQVSAAAGEGATAVVAAAEASEMEASDELTMLRAENAKLAKMCAKPIKHCPVLSSMSLTSHKG